MGGADAAAVGWPPLVGAVEPAAAGVCARATAGRRKALWLLLVVVEKVIIIVWCLRCWSYCSACRPVLATTVVTAECGGTTGTAAHRTYSICSPALLLSVLTLKLSTRDHKTECFRLKFQHLFLFSTSHRRRTRKFGSDAVQVFSTSLEFLRQFCTNVGTFRRIKIPTYRA